ncbi:hypothetical protein DFQ26_000809 [Actinomortierella ambigua]|nr:hypothetical protein DFQ26_000809 [Actinomortierella ambigua]
MSGTSEAGTSSTSSSRSNNGNDTHTKSFMSSYMSGLNQGQDSHSFLQQNQPTFTSPNQQQQQQQAPPTTSTAAAQTLPSSASGSHASAPADQTKRPAFDEATTIPGAHPLPSGHNKEQREAIHKAALDNCADLNLELADCLLGRAGTWWDRASMCMKQKERFSKCCIINKDILTEREYGKEGNTPQQDRDILDYADKIAQAKLKEEKQ